MTHVSETSGVVSKPGVRHVPGRHCGADTGASSAGGSGAVGQDLSLRPAPQIQPFDWASRAASARVDAPVLPIAAERWLRTVPTERWARAAITATGDPSRA